MVNNIHDRRSLISAILLSGLAKDYIDMVNITSAESRDFDTYNVSLDLLKKIDDFNTVVYKNLEKSGLAEQIQKEIDVLHDRLYKILK